MKEWKIEREGDIVGQSLSKGGESMCPMGHMLGGGWSREEGGTVTDCNLAHASTLANNPSGTTAKSLCPFRLPA